MTLECLVLGLLPLQDARVENEKTIAVGLDEDAIRALLDLRAITREQQMALQALQLTLDAGIASQ